MLDSMENKIAEIAEDLDVSYGFIEKALERTIKCMTLAHRRIGRKSIEIAVQNMSIEELKTLVSKINTTEETIKLLEAAKSERQFNNALLGMAKFLRKMMQSNTSRERNSYEYWYHKKIRRYCARG